LIHSRRKRDPSAVAFDDGLAGPQPQPVAALELRGEERLEDVAAHLLGDAFALVFNAATSTSSAVL
jgi:hypothetical protein